MTGEKSDTTDFASVKESIASTLRCVTGDGSHIRGTGGPGIQAGMRELIPGNETDLGLIIECLAHPFFVVDARNYKIITANSFAGLTVGETCHQQLHGNDVPCWKLGTSCPINLIKEKKKAVRVEHGCIDQNGEKRFMDVHCHPVLDQEGNVCKVVQYILDISDRKNAEIALRQKETNYRNLVERIPHGIVEFDTTGTLTLSNKAHHDILGYEYGELSGQKIWDLAGSEEGKRELKKYILFLLNHRPFPAPFVGKNTRKDGRAVTVKVDWNYKEDGEGNITGFVGIVTDITDQKQTLEEAKNLAAVVRQATDSIVLTDTDGNINYVNPAFEELTGYTLEEVRGKNPRVLRAPGTPYSPEYYLEMWAHVKGGKVWKGEFLNQKKNGDHFIEEASIFPLRQEPDSEITGFGAVKKDITLRRQLEEQLKNSYNEVVYLKDKAEDANRMKSQFLAAMSHDIRTPLNAIMGFTDLLLKGERRKEPQDFLQKLKTSGEGLLNLINDILDLTKIEAGQLDVYPQSFRVADLNMRICSVFELQFKQKELQFETKMDADVPDVIFSDKWRIDQVLTNLLSNALKFTHSGKVSFFTYYLKATDMMIFEIKDTGIGIAPQYLEQIFDPFSQLRLGDAGSQKGTGLGLAICKKLLQLMGGTITVGSIRQQGSAFSVSIPANSDEVNTDMVADSGKANTDIVVESLPGKQGDQLQYKTGNRILIAEDNPVNMELLCEQLKEEGFDDLVTAENGEEAVEKALTLSPDLILMDIEMPLMNGNEATAYLRKKNCTIPIIVLSAYAMHDDIEKSKQAGAEGYITKPIDFNTFFFRISPFLDIKKKNAAAGPPDNDRRKTEVDGLNVKKSISDRMKKIFLQDVETKLEQVNALFDADDLSADRNKLKVIAHGYMGNAAYFGLPDLERAADCLEQAIKNGENDQAVKTLAKELAEVLETILHQNRNENRMDTK
ncbi:MAG: PAS domain S-box protein [bacterium]|nr:PAS domain S-box protein [bacterium]